MTKDDFGVFASEKVGELIDAALSSGLSFDEALDELRYQIMNAAENREDYGA